jgi:flagellar export protein FliJ
MRFHFRLDTLMRQRKVDRDTAQRIYSEAQSAVQAQLAFIKRLYDEVDQARMMVDERQASQKSTAPALVQIDEFIQGQKIRIKAAREKARELMFIAEEKHEILTLKMQDFKVLERLKEKKQAEFKKEQLKAFNDEMDDLVIMRANRRGVI